MVVGKALLDSFETRVGNKLILMAQGVSGDVESRAFRICGVYRAEMEETEKRLVFVPRAAAQEMLGMGDMVSEIEVKLPDHEDSERVAATLAESLPDHFLPFLMGAVGEMAADPELTASLARLDRRLGYRPRPVAIGAVRETRPTQ